MRNVRLSTDHCFSMFQHATHTLDTAWPWASEAYGLCRLRAYFCAHGLIRARSYGFKRATKSIVALDTAWPWANDTYGLCCLRAYFCAHKLIRARSYVAIPQLGIAMGFLLQIRMSWLRALSKGCRCWCWCCGPGCWCCELAERAFKTGGGAGRVQAPRPVLSAGRAHARCGGAVSWLCRLRTFVFQPVACQQVVGFCLLSGSMLV